MEDVCWSDELVLKRKCVDPSEPESDDICWDDFDVDWEDEEGTTGLDMRHLSEELKKEQEDHSRWLTQTNEFLQQVRVPYSLLPIIKMYIFYTIKPTYYLRGGGLSCSQFFKKIPECKLDLQASYNIQEATVFFLFCSPLPKQNAYVEHLAISDNTNK